MPNIDPALIHPHGFCATWANANACTLEVCDEGGDVVSAVSGCETGHAYVEGLDPSTSYTFRVVDETTGTDVVNGTVRTHRPHSTSVVAAADFYTEGSPGAPLALTVRRPSADTITITWGDSPGTKVDHYLVTVSSYLPPAHIILCEEQTHRVVGTELTLPSVWGAVHEICVTPVGPTLVEGESTAMVVDAPATRPIHLVRLP